MRVYIAEFKGAYLAGSIVVTAHDLGQAVCLANQKLEEADVTGVGRGGAPPLTLEDFKEVNMKVANVAFFNYGDY